VKSPAVPMAMVQGVGQVLPSDVCASTPDGFDSIRSAVVVAFGLNASKLLQAASPKPHIKRAKARSSFMSAIPHSTLRRRETKPPHREVFWAGCDATQARRSWRSRDWQHAPHLRAPGPGPARKAPRPPTQGESFVADQAAATAHPRLTSKIPRPPGFPTASDVVSESP
jgi:hypothetical protein